MRLVHARVPAARAGAQAPVHPPRLSPARPLGGGRGGLSRERDARAGPRARRRARDRARRGRADRAGATRGRPGRGPVGPVGRLRRRRALLRAARRSRTGGRRSRRPGTARDRAPAPGWPRDGRRVRRRDDRVRDRGQRQRRLGTWTGRRARIDAARRRLPSAAGPVRAAAASRGRSPDCDHYVPGIEREGLYFRDDTPARIVAGLHWEVHGDAERPEDPDAFRQAVDWEYCLRVAEALAPAPGGLGVSRHGGVVGALPARARHAADRGADARGGRPLPGSRRWWRRRSDLASGRRDGGRPDRDGGDSRHTELDPLPSRPLRDREAPATPCSEAGR